MGHLTTLSPVQTDSDTMTYPEFEIEVSIDRYKKRTPALPMDCGGVGLIMGISNV